MTFLNEKINLKKLFEESKNKKFSKNFTNDFFELFQFPNKIILITYFKENEIKFVENQKIEGKNILVYKNGCFEYFLEDKKKIKILETNEKECILLIL